MDESFDNEKYIHQYGEEHYSPDCPACLRHLAHSNNEHYTELQRVHAASSPDFDEMWGSFYEG